MKCGTPIVNVALEEGGAGDAVTVLVTVLVLVTVFVPPPP